MEEFHPGLVLCPIDFSDSAGLALRYAQAFARSSQSGLLVIYADTLDPPPYFTSEQVEELVESRKRERQAADLHLERYVKDVLGDDSDTEIATVEGRAVSSILTVADERKAGLIIMGAHGLGGFNRLMLGSVTERVLRETDKPLLSVPLGGASNAATITRILCPVNFSDVAYEALEYAIGVARAFKAELIALNVMEPGTSEPQKDQLSDRLCSWVPDEFRQTCTLTHVVRKGNAAEQIIETVAAASCDLVVLGSLHKRFSDTTVIGSTTDRVVRHTPCPVLAFAGREPI